MRNFETRSILGITVALTLVSGSIHASEIIAVYGAVNVRVPARPGTDDAGYKAAKEQALAQLGSADEVQVAPWQYGKGSWGSHGVYYVTYRARATFVQKDAAKPWFTRTTTKTWYGEADAKAEATETAMYQCNSKVGEPEFWDIQKDVPNPERPDFSFVTASARFQCLD